jgi:hypothetical protein
MHPWAISKKEQGWLHCYGRLKFPPCHDPSKPQVNRLGIQGMLECISHVLHGFSVDMSWWYHGVCPNRPSWRENQGQLLEDQDEIHLPCNRSAFGHSSWYPQVITVIALHVCIHAIEVYAIEVYGIVGRNRTSEYVPYLFPFEPYPYGIGIQGMVDAVVYIFHSPVDMIWCHTIECTISYAGMLCLRLSNSHHTTLHEYRKLYTLWSTVI